MLDIDNNTEPNLQRLVNLYSFLVIYLFQDSLQLTSPDYLIEKWNHWIGTDVKLKPNVIQPGQIIAFSDYRKRWHLDTDEKILDVKEIFYFINAIDDDDIRVYIHWFQHFGGELTKICSKKKTGLHPIAHNKVKSLMQDEQELLKIFLRDMKIDTLELD